MKEYEYIGVMCAIVAYTLIVTGTLQMGFYIGLVGSLALFVYFITIKSFASVGLQSFFICANMYGLFNLGVF